MIPTFDFETYSEAGYYFDRASGSFKALQAGKPGIASINAAVYAAHPSTRVISLAYDMLDGSGARLWVPEGPVPGALFDYIRNGGDIEAHNSQFEYFIWLYICAARMGWPVLPLNQLRCSMAKAKAYALPAALGAISDVLNADEKKDKRGGQLIRLLSIPKKPTKKDGTLYRTLDRYPDLYADMYRYNVQDVRSEINISARIPELSPFELSVWQLDQTINARGVAIDTESLDACIRVFNETHQLRTDELYQITEGAVRTIGEMAKLKSGDQWLQSIGVNMPSLNKAGVKDALERPDLPAVARRSLEIRQEIGGASVKKIFSMKRCLNVDDRIRGLFAYCGAERTGRFAGRGPQPQNLRNGGPDCIHCGACGAYTAMVDNLPACRACGSLVQLNRHEWGNTTAKAALNDIRTLDAAAVGHRWGSVVDLIGSCMRSLFQAAPGYDLIGSDYSAIEAVVLAALAGEQWRLDVFGTHGKIYEASAARAFNIPLEEILEHKTRTGKHHPLRKRGKVRELANGYSGWVNASKQFGHAGTDDEIKADVLSWRDESPNIVEMWGGQYRKTPGKWRFTPELYGVEGCFINAILYPGYEFGYRDIWFIYDQGADILSIILPSGRSLYYHSPELFNQIDARGLSCYGIRYRGVDSYTSRWGWINTYGGKLTENIVQAVARDILVAAMLRVETAGYPIVLHIHDEIIAEILRGFGSIEEFEAIMAQREAWFSDWPIRVGGGWRGRRFRK